MNNKIFQQEIGYRLRNLSYRKKGYIYKIPTGDKKSGTIGFIVASQHLGEHEIKVTPVIGFCHELLEEMFYELTGFEKPKHYPATVSTSIGYLMPQNEYLEWHFTNDQNKNQNHFREIMELIDLYAEAFHKHHNVDLNLLNTLVSGSYIRLESKQYKLPILLHLLNQNEAALEYIDTILANEPDSEATSISITIDSEHKMIEVTSGQYYSVTDYYKRFSQNFRNL